MTSRIEFINHASVLVSNEKVAVLSDPWYFGDIFHKGWSLLVENDDRYIREVLGRTTHIWISHEHPDHFSPPFFMKYRDLILGNNIRILFQKTRDQRVAAFLKAKGFAVDEVPEGQLVSLASNFHLRIIKSDLYDSALLLEVEGTRILNLNDCPLHSQDNLAAFVKQYGTCDILLTQFSYAAWKGGRDHAAWRKRAAKSKIQAMAQQIEYLKPVTCIPFASFVRFSHELNSYMNDEINRPADILKAFEENKTDIVFMKPGEIQNLEDIAPQQKSAEFWEKSYDAALAEKQIEYGVGVSVETLKTGFERFQTRMFENNSRILMQLANWFLPIRPFGKTNIRLQESGTILCLDLLGELRVVEGEAADVEMHSQSLDFIFRNEFGFDTLFVNGCFEEVSSEGFSRFAKCFAIGNLNSMGLFVNLYILRRLDVVYMLLGKLLIVRRNMNGRS